MERLPLTLDSKEEGSPTGGTLPRITTLRTSDSFGDSPRIFAGTSPNALNIPETSQALSDQSSRGIDEIRSIERLSSFRSQSASFGAEPSFQPALQEASTSSKKLSDGWHSSAWKTNEEKRRRDAEQAVTAMQNHDPRRLSATLVAAQTRTASKNSAGSGSPTSSAAVGSVRPGSPQSGQGSASLRVFTAQRRRSSFDIVNDEAAAAAAAALQALEEAEPEAEVQEAEEENPTDPMTILVHMLEKLPILHDCGRGFITEVATHTKTKSIVEGERLELRHGGPLLVVEKGALKVKLGKGPPTVIGPGTSFNVPGLLKLLHEAEYFRRPQNKDGNKAAPYVQGDVPDDGSASGEGGGGRRGSTSTTNKRGSSSKNSSGAEPRSKRNDEAAILWNLCYYGDPHHTFSYHIASNFGGEWLPLVLEGAAKGVVPDIGGNKEDYTEGGAILRCISGPMLRDAGILHEDGMTVLGANVRRLTEIWGAILERCSYVLPLVPPEVTWQIAEVSIKTVVEEGEVIVQESDLDPDTDSLILIDTGRATIEKQVGGERCTNTIIGRLGAGAIIGDLRLLGANIPRPATVRTTEQTTLITMPASRLRQLILKFPGVLSACHNALEELAQLMILRLPRKDNVLSSLALFTDMDATSLSDIAGDCEQRYFCSGHNIKMEGSDDATLYALEFGECGIFVQGLGQVATVPVGNCFGDRTLIGLAKVANSTVKAITPLVLCLALDQRVLENCMIRNRNVQRHFEIKRRTYAGGFTTGRLISHIPVFQETSSLFLEAIASSIKMTTYLPRLTIIVEGAQDAAQMFVLNGGQVAVEKGDKVLNEMSPPATFGELAMLGAVRRRSVTIRAVSHAFLIEISRYAFLAAVDKFPNERKHFEKLAVQHLDEAKEVVWPMLKNEPRQLVYYLNLYAERRICHPGEQSLDEAVNQKAAILILSGEVSLRDSVTGAETEVLEVGDCFNVHSLLGITEEKMDLVVPVTQVEAQILKKETWDKIISEFPERQDSIRKRIMKVLATWAERRRSDEMGSIELLKRSGIFRGMSQKMMHLIREKLEDVVCEPGEIVLQAGRADSSLYMLLDGIAVELLEDGSNKATIIPGQIYGEAVLLGLSTQHSATIKTQKLCIFQLLHQDDFHACVNQFPVESRQIQQLTTDKGLVHPFPKGVPLKDKLATLSVFQQSDRDFFSKLMENVLDVFYAPGELVLEHGEPCIYGKTGMLAVLAGRLIVKSDREVMLGTVFPGELCGEGGAMGLVAERSVEVCAWKDGYVHCALISGESCKIAFDSMPEQGQVLQQFHAHRGSRNKEFLERRDHWMKNVVLPALMRARLFQRCPVEFLMQLASPLTETMYRPGKTIATAGDVSDQMIIILEGEAAIEAPNGTRVGQVQDGASFGEMALLGLFFKHMATIRTLCPCRVLEITKEALQRALAAPLPECEQMRVAFAVLHASRHEQLLRGMPMSTLPLGIKADSICSRLVGLHAERIDAAPGESWEPLPDSDPCGPHLAIFVRGRVSVEFADDRIALPLKAGSLVMEGMIAEYDMRYRALGHCEMYRIRQSDMLLALMSSGTNLDDFYKFRLLEKQAQKYLQSRLSSAQGVVEGFSQHPQSECISIWRANRIDAMSKASVIKDEKLSRSESTLGQESTLMMSSFSTMDGHNMSKLTESVMTGNTPSVCFGQSTSRVGRASSAGSSRSLARCSSSAPDLSRVYVGPAKRLPKLSKEMAAHDRKKHERRAERKAAGLESKQVVSVVPWRRFNSHNVAR